MSESFFATRQGKVIIAHKSSATRSCLMEVIRGIGFEVEGCEKPKDILNRLEVENFDWALTPIAQEEQVNGFHILGTLNQVPERNHCHVSFLLDENQAELLPVAFELGLLNWFLASASKDAQTEEAQKMLARLGLFHYNTALYAASLLREILLKSLQYNKLIPFCETIAKIIPNNTHAMHWLAEAYFLGGQPAEGRKLIAQIKAYDPEGSQSLESKYIPQGETIQPQLGVNSIFYIDPDESLQKSMTELLNKSGVSNVQCFSDAFAASAAINKNPPDLLITEWKLPVLTGVNLIQRIRSEGHHEIPIVILSSLVKKSDAPILAEMSIANVIEKPFREQDVLTSLAWTLFQEKNPTQRRNLERKMTQFLLKGRFSEASQLRTRLESEKSYPAASRLYNSALFLFYSGKYANARLELSKAISAGSDPLASLNLMGKCCMKLRDFKSAIVFLERAQSASPNNITRMAELAESHAETGNIEAANHILEEAAERDHTSKIVLGTQAKVDIMDGQTKKALSILESLGTPESLIADLNNSAVAQVRVGKIKEGLKLYAQTLEAIPPHEHNIKAKVCYNLALAYARSNHLEEARTELAKIRNISNAQVRGKVSQFLQKVEAAIREDRLLNFESGGTEIYNELDTAESPEGTTSASHPTSPRFLLSSVMPGQRNLYRIFALPESEKLFAKALLAGQPRFTLRKAIVRDGAPTETHAHTKPN